jgi:predicted GIY-YIG superfamily endonuclease
MYYFYVVRCADNSLYCGQTQNIEQRIADHNVSKSKGAKYTRARRPISLVYFELFETRVLAMKREVQVKRWPKFKKEVLITTVAPPHVIIT